MQRRRSYVPIVVLLVVTFVLASVPTYPARAQGGGPEILWDVCPFTVPPGEEDGVTMECGYLQVPQDRAEPDGRWIELAFAILYSTGANPAPDPLLYLEGGPGGSALFGIDAWVDSPYRADRAIILLDQRGTGYSLPRLVCREMDEIDEFASDQEVLEARRDCRVRLEDEYGVDLADYHSATSAADIADLRSALGIETWNLYGISYGTRLALTVMRDYPAGVRSVILDSVYPPNVDAYEEQIASAYRVFRVLFDACAADSTCAQAYPDLEARFYALVDDLNADPPDLDAWGGEFWGDDLVDVLFQVFYSSPALPYLPLAITDAEAGSFDMLLDLYDGYLPGETDEGDDSSAIESDLVAEFFDEFDALSDTLNDDEYNAMWDMLYETEPGVPGDIIDVLWATFDADDADYLESLLNLMTADEFAMVEDELFYEDLSDTEGLFDAVECYEEVPFNSTSDAEAIAAAVPPQIVQPLIASLDTQIAVCDVWMDVASPAFENDPVVSDIPTLVLSGEYDPVTPPEWGQRAAATLSHSVYVEFPGVGHGAIDGGDCPVNIGLAFLDDPGSPPDVACVESMAGPVFALP